MGGYSKCSFFALSWAWFCLCSILGTCLHATVVLMVMIGTRFWRLSNYLYIRTLPTWKLSLAYSSMILVTRFFTVWDEVCSAVNRLSPLDMLTRIGTSFTNIQSNASITIRCQSRVILGICTYLIRTGLGGLLTVLPFTPARSGLKIRLACFTTFSVMLQLDTCLNIPFPGICSLWTEPWMANLKITVYLVVL